jgi:ferric-dicitrate binding protein FerR (iron transport regulator)
MSMKSNTVKGALAIALLGLFAPTSSAQSGSLGSVTVSGPVLIDGQTASSASSVSGTARLATGDGGSAVLALTSGGEVRLVGQTDAIVSSTNGRVSVHLICGEVQVNSVAPAVILSASGGRVTSVGGDVVVVTGGRNEDLKRGRSRDFSGNVTLTAGGAGSAVTVVSGRRCDCGCGSAFGGRP